jgi:hypothetical protein
MLAAINICSADYVYCIVILVIRLVILGHIFREFCTPPFDVLVHFFVTMVFADPPPPDPPAAGLVPPNASPVA